MNTIETPAAGSLGTGGHGTEPDAATIDMPRLGTYADMRRLTGKAYPTIAKWVCRKKLRPGVYVGHGLFNIYRVREYLDKGETFFLKPMK